MDETTNQTDDNTFTEGPSPEWEKVADVRKTTAELVKLVENAHGYLANAEKQHSAGKQLDAQAVLDTAQTLLQKVYETQKTASASTTETLLDMASGEIDYWAHVKKRKETATTGLTGFNEMLGGGLEPQRLMVLAGAPGGGKTTLANQIAEFVARSEKGRPVLYVTSEDQPFTLLAKTLARQARIDYTAVLKGYDAEKARISEALTNYQASHAAQRLRYLDATVAVSLDTIKERARVHFEAFKESGSGLLIVDYLQRIARASGLFRSNGDLRQSVTLVTEQLKAMASELECTVMVLASQHRAGGYGTSNNTLSSAKESGDIEYTADVFMAIGDDSERIANSNIKPKVLELAKNRQGATGAVNLDFFARIQQFTEAAKEDDNSSTSNSNSNGRRTRK